MERLYSGEKEANRSSVVLCHGLFVNSAFLNLDEEHSLARYLAQEGFDVWNLSLRGTGRSLNPLRGGPKSWTLDDIIEKDLSAVIRYVQKESRKSKVHWVGHGMGGMLLYGYLAKKGGAGLSAGVAVGAPVTFGHSRQEPIKKLLKLRESEFLKKVFLYLNAPFLGRILLPLIPGIESVFYNPDNLDDELKAKLMEVALADIEPGVLDHLLQIIAEGEFVSATGHFNYRRNLSKARIPLLLVGGEKDVIAPPAALKDVERALNSADRRIRVLGPGLKDSAAYGHFDLVLGKKAKQEVFPVIARWLRQKSGQD